mmetsp:Transcript_6988/g.11601  ORF Transcript_6988/g.11601 Transcript_6988/m.11601 type:complete len:240 (+) Transcript_6988:495-1214(+)
MTPITLGINVTQVQGLVDSAVDARNTGGNLTSHKGAATARGLVVEEDTVGKVHAVGFSVVDKDPEGILLGNSIWGTWVEWSGLRLRDLLDLSVKLRGGCLVETHSLFETSSTDGIEHTQDTDSVTVSGVLWHIKGNLDVGHGTEIVDLSWLDIGDDGNQVGGVAKITVMKEDLDSSFVTVSVDVVDTTSVEARRTTDDTVDGVALFEQEFSQVRTILTGDTRDQCNLAIRRHVVVVCFV